MLCNSWRSYSIRWDGLDWCDANNPQVSLNTWKSICGLCWVVVALVSRSSWWRLSLGLWLRGTEGKRENGEACKAVLRPWQRSHPLTFPSPELVAWQPCVIRGLDSAVSRTFKESSQTEHWCALVQLIIIFSELA